MKERLEQGGVTLMDKSIRSRKNRDLFSIMLMYIFSYILACLPVVKFDNVMLEFFVFDILATVVIFIFSVIKVNSSVYDAYWSLTPMVMIIWLFAEVGGLNLIKVLFLIVFNLWAVRLTVNWVTVFTDFSYEDWRYRKFRSETGRIWWPIVNFWGIHMIPTLVVFAAMLPVFVIAGKDIGLLSLPGIFIMLGGILLEMFADNDMHKFLEENMNKADKSVCRRGLWKFSRHPNYLGEITFWLGVYVTMIPYASEYWYYIIGFVSVALLFNFVSIPLMEKRQLARRSEYKQYCKETSRLLILPNKNIDNA